MRALLIVVSFFYSAILFSQNKEAKPIEINSGSQNLEVSGNFLFLLTDDLKINQRNLLAFKNKMKPYCDCVKDDKLQLPKILWLKADLVNTSNDTLNLVFRTSNAPEVDAWVFSENDTLTKTIGFVQKSEERYSKEIFSSFSFELLPFQKKQIILRQEVHTLEFMIAKFDISSTAAFENYLLGAYQYYHGSRLLLSLLCGGIFMLFFYNLFVFFRTKTKNNLFYSFYLFFTFIYILVEIDRNQYFFFGSVILYFDLIKEISYGLSIVFYCLFIRSILINTQSYFKIAFQSFIILSGGVLIYLSYSYWSHFYGFSAFSRSLLSYYKAVSFAFILLAISQLYRNIKVPFIKYVFIGSLILVFSYLLQEILASIGRKIFDLDHYKIYIKTNLSILIGTLAQILFLSYALYIKTLQLEKEKYISENLNTIKSRFFANISHEFRTPLTLIKSPVQSLQTDIKDENQKSKLRLIDANADRMLELVDQLLELSKIDSGNVKLILKEGNISSFLASIIESFAFQSKEKGIHFTANIQKTLENNLFDKDVIEKIVTNLVSNAFKYAPPNEAIAFTASVENLHLKLVVSNTGTDVKKEDLPKLLERFYQKNEADPGVGIGLALVKELVELYQGTFTTSLENDELSFSVNLPLAMNHENAVVIASEPEMPIIKNAIDPKTELPVLLIVDDNAEIRSLLKDIFKTGYQVLEAYDGEKGLQLAQKEIPDCILSDVMMPKMDGFEFTRQIKDNELTSFIPVALLTAKTSDEAHLEGLKSTADAYLTKPFNNAIVKATVNQLIGERKKLHQRYSQELVLRPVDIVINAVDEKFIEKLQVILDKELSNPDFSSENFAAAAGMSRMQLHRKLKSLLGVSATEFIRNERLKMAAALLKKSNGNISEIAYAVGFNDVSYFSKCFRERFGSTPSDCLGKK
ncbi:MAG TPA: response regulator [Flavobacterium sp.]|nr:response regulator [Flavobacterium sp.]HPJ11245.1 response regulator [Flavobacterium sp.]